MNTISNLGWFVIVLMVVFIVNVVSVAMIAIGWGIVLLWRRITRPQA